VLIESDSSAYSTAYELADGSIGVLYELNGYSEIVFAKVELTEFMGTEKVLPASNSVELKLILRNIRPIKQIGPDMQPTRHVPEVDMGQFHSSVRKEVGASGGNASNEPLFTTEELDRFLGPARPGWHLGDEIRWSGCLINNSDTVITDVEVRTSISQDVFEVKTLNPGESLNFLDLREVVSKEKLTEGKIRTALRASYRETDAYKEQSSEKLYETSSGYQLN
jgi:sialidase-1